MDIRLQEIANGAAGLYFLTYDNSQTASIPVTTTLRCVMTNFKKGPVNNLIYISKGDTEGFKKLFGDIDRRDERNGNFSHRTCLWLLENGPIVVCNLRSFDDEKDLAGMIGLSTTFGQVNDVINLTPFKSLFNTDRLWYNDPKRLLNQENKSILNIANVGSSDVSIFVRKSTVEGYDATIKEWYTSLNLDIPQFINPNDKISDSMIDVFIFKTNFGDNQRNMTNENYGHLFTEKGLKPYSEQNGVLVDSLDLLKQITDAQYIGNYTGSLIPGFINQAKQPMQIEQILNATVGTTGLSVKIDEAYMEDLGDWEPKDDNEPTTTEDAFSSKYRRPYAIDLTGHSYTKYENDAIKFDAVKNILSYKIGDIVEGSAVVGTTPWDLTLDDVYNADITKLPIFVNNIVANGKYSEFYMFDAVALHIGDNIVDSHGNFANVIDAKLVNSNKISDVATSDKIEYNLVKITLDSFAYIESVTPATDFSVTENGTDVWEFTTLGNVYKVKSLYEFTNTMLQAIVLPSYKPRSEQFCNGTSTQQGRILDVMNLPNMVKGFKNAQNLRFRYVIDAFKTFIEPNYKYQFTTLVKELSEKSTMFCRAILNEAFVDEMGTSINPYFKNSPTGIFDTRYIAQGGNPQLLSSNRYTKPKDGDVYSFFFGPGLRVNHQGSEIITPIAGLVGKAFLDKYTNKFPYTVTANNSGVINGANVIGVETDFDQDDRKYLERVGYNAIVNDLDKGLLIYGNNTAQTHIKTDLSKIHVSELVAFIQEQMMVIMKDYVFEWNDYQNRLEIKKRADNVMLQILSNRGIYWFENICDASNNGEEIIENDMGVLDTRIIAAKAGEKWVHRTYLERGSNIVGFEII